MKAAVAHSSAEVTCIVSPEMCAILDERLIHPVYSTFWLCYHAEVAARRAIEAFFDEGENAVGASVSLRHEAMCAVGDHVTVRARVSEVKGAKIVCEIEAHSASRRIATGTQTQIVMTQATIDERIAEAQKLKA